MAERGVYVERASTDRQRVAPLRDVHGDRALHVAAARAGGGRRRAQRASRRRRGLGRRARPGGPGLADARGAAPSSRPPTRSSATRPTSRACPRGAGSAATRSDNRVEAERARARARAGGRRRARGGRLLRRPRDLRDGRRRARGGRRATRWRRRGARRPGAVGDAGGRGAGRRAARPRLLRALAVGPAQAVGRRSSAGWTPRARPTSCSRSTTRPRGRGASSSSGRRSVLLRHRAPATPVVVARAVGAREEAVTVTTLGGLDADVVDMRTLLIVGSSTTRVIANGASPRASTRRAATRRERAPTRRPRRSWGPSRRRAAAGRAVDDDDRQAALARGVELGGACGRRRCPW